MVDPFAHYLQKQRLLSRLAGRQTAAFSLMFLKNAMGNGFYLLGGYYFLDDKIEEESKIEK